MKRILLAALLTVLSSQAFAQNLVAPCVTIQNGVSRSCNAVTSSNPLPTTTTTAPTSATGKYAAKTITNSSTQILAATSRIFLDIKNESASATISCSFGGTAALNTAGSYTIPPNWHASWSGSFVPADAVNCISSAATSPATFGAD